MRIWQVVPGNSQKTEPAHCAGSVFWTKESLQAGTGGLGRLVPGLKENRYRRGLAAETAAESIAVSAAAEEKQDNPQAAVSAAASASVIAAEETAVAASAAAKQDD